MSKKVTKMRSKKERSRRARKYRNERRVAMLIYAFVFVCVGIFASMGFLNAGEDRRSVAEWYVPSGTVEILAEPKMSTLQSGPQMPMNQVLPASTPVVRATPVPLPVIPPLPAATQAPVPPPFAVPEVTEEPGLPSFVTPMPTQEPAQPPFMRPDSPMDEVDDEPLEYVPITITAVGDCTLGGNIPNGYDKYFNRYADKYGYDYFFENVRGLFESDDLTIVNLEGPLTTSKDMRGGRAFNFRGKPEYVNILSGSSVEICNIANNHALDFGKAGFTETAQVLTDAGIGASGFSVEYFTDVKGVRVGSLGFTEWEYSKDEIQTAIREARPKCDLLLVSVHWGKEGSHETTSTQRKLGRAMIDAGADVVIGTHTHVSGGVEKYKGKYIVYSLGNFCFGGNRNPKDKNCMIFQQTFNVSRTDGTVTDGGINIIPALISSQSDTNDYQPTILTGERAAQQLARIAKVSDVDAGEILWMDPSRSPNGAAVALGRGA